MRAAEEKEKEKRVRRGGGVEVTDIGSAIVVSFHARGRNNKQGDRESAPTISSRVSIQRESRQQIGGSKAVERLLHDWLSRGHDLLL